MCFSARLIFSSALYIGAVFSALPVFAQQPPAPATPQPTIDGRAAWDERYVYFAFRIDDTDLLATNTTPMSDVEKDDSIGVYFDVKGRPETPSEFTRAMLVSAASGFTFLAGNEAQKTLAPRPTFTIKYGVTLQGTVNRSDDKDKGYIVTLAVPLDALGLDPKTIKPGTEVTFVAVARRRGAGEDKGGLTSTAEGVKTEADLLSPAKWGKLLLAPPEDPKAPIAPAAGTLVAPHIAPNTPAPQIDGIIRDDTWPATAKFAFASPDIPKPEIAVVPTNIAGSDSYLTAPPLNLPPTLNGVAPLVMARYMIGYQADPRKAASPVRGLFLPDTTLGFADQPATGIGPWFSNDRTSWHRSQLAEMRNIGIDAALVSIAGPDYELGNLDEKALVVLVTALKEMAGEGVPAPLVAPCIDTGFLVTRDKPKPDLATPEGREAVYRAIRRWFTMVPPQLRVRITLPPDANGRIVNAYPVYLSDARGLTNINNPDWMADIRTRFAADFGVSAEGTTLLLCGGEGFPTDANLPVVTPLLKSGKGSGPIATAVVQPGAEGPGTILVPRRTGKTFRESWEAAVGAKATWLIIDSWNDWVRGTEIAQSRQYGNTYLDLTRLLTVQSAIATARNVVWLNNDAPRRFRPGQLVTVTVTVKNTGTEVLDGAKGFALVYRWRNKDGQIVAESPLRLNLTRSLLPTRTVSLPIGVLAAKANDDGRLQALPPGEYTLEVGVTNSPPLAKAIFLGDDPASGANPPMKVPVTILEELPEVVEFGSTTTPTMLVGGATYPVQLKLRWLGNEPLTPDKAQLLYQILTEDGKQTVLTATVPLTRALQPGLWMDVFAEVKLGDAGGPLPAACPETRKSSTDVTGGGYKIRWLLSRKESTDAVPGELIEHIAVYPPTDEARITPPSQPARLEANALTTMEVTVVNRSATKWAKGAYAVGCHWYYPDGIEYQWQPPITTALPKDLGPGEAIKVPVTVRVPDRDGAYVLSFDIIRNPDTFLSSQAVTRVGDTGLIPVRITGGRLTFIDLTRLFNVDAVSTEANPKDGDFDGQGNTFPAESFPPDDYGIAAFFSVGKEGKPEKITPVYPSGFYADFSHSARLVSFRYGLEADGAKNAVACQGQKIPIPSGKFVSLHLAAAATGGEDRPLTVVLRYKDNTEKSVTVTVADWTRAQGEADPIAVRAFRKRGKDGDTATMVSVRHLIVPVDITKELVSVTLPQDDKIKVFGMTLEK